MRKFKKTISIILCMLMLLSVVPIGISAQSVDESILENWSTVSAKFSSRTHMVITRTTDEGDHVPKTEGFDYSVSENNGIKVITPSYDVFPGEYGISMIKSGFTASLNGLCVEIMPDEFDFTVNEDGYGNYFSVVWSQEVLKEITADANAAEFAGKGFRNLIPTNKDAEDFVIGTPASEADAEKCNGKALCINIGNRNAGSDTLTASDVSIIYYDGYYVDPVFNEAGYRWVFTQKDDTHGYESIDISKGLRISVRESTELGFIVNINGKDYCYAADAAYGSEAEIDLSGLEGKGYVTVGAVAGSEYCNYTVTRINNRPAAQWKGEYAYPTFDNWTVDAVKFSTRTLMPIVDKQADGSTIMRTNGFTGDVVDGGIFINHPDYDTFPGEYSATAVTSKYTTPLDKLNVVIEPEDFTFSIYEKHSSSNHLSVVWSEGKPVAFNTEHRSSDFAYFGLRDIIDPNGGKALVVDLANYNSDFANNLTASRVTVTYYDGSYYKPYSDMPGYVWTFDDNAEGIDITNGVEISVRSDAEYGFVVSVNGKDFCSADAVSNFDENIGAKVDLTGLTDTKRGYLSIGGVCAGDDGIRDCDYRIASVNGINAADWQGESEALVFENWSMQAVKFSSRTNQIIAPSGIIKTVGFKGAEIDGAIKIDTPDYNTFEGRYATTVLTSDNTTPLAGLEVFIEADDINFETDKNFISSHLSVMWSEGKPASFTTEANAADHAVDSLRPSIDPEGGKALVVDVTGSESASAGVLTASQVRITYYDGSYISPFDSRPGYRWIFEVSEGIDISNGLNIKVRENGEYGFIVSVNGVDFCAAENVTYFDENIGTKVDLTGLSDAGKGYISVASVCSESDIATTYRLVSVNGVDAADWQGTRTVPTVTSDGIKVTVAGLYGVKDFFIAKGEYSTYSDVKANRVVQISAAKIGDSTEYTYNVPAPGMHTVYVRYTDGDYKILYVDVSVLEPTFTQNGLQLVLGNLEGIKVVRTAYGEYNKVADIKRAGGARAFTARYIKDTSAYTVQYRENGIVTVAVCYENGYTVIEHFEITKKAPEFTQGGNTVTFSALEGLKVLRYAKGEYATSTEIKKAEGSVALTPAKVVDGKISVTLSEGRYTFCVQYDDESYNYYTVDIA